MSMQPHAAARCLRPGATSVSSSEAFCHASSSATPSLISQHDGAEDWEYLVAEEPTEHSVGHLIFSPAPTEEEVEDATNELLNLHGPNICPLPTPGSGTSLDGSPAVAGSLSQAHDSGSPKAKDEQQVGDKSFKLLGMLAAGSSVYQAFQLMRSNSEVQGTVKSLACDPAVWKAVLNNEKVQELAQSLQDMAETSGHNRLLCAEVANSDVNFCLKVASKALVHVTAKVLQLLDKIIEIMGSFSEYLEKSFSTECTSVIDKTVASCLMLAVAVLSVVIIKRLLFK